MLFQNQRDYLKAVKELAKATELDSGNAQVRAVLQLCMHHLPWGALHDSLALMAMRWCVLCVSLRLHACIACLESRQLQ
jgi:polysaccharide pyruvyl transferase WcaK-like protein